MPLSHDPLIGLSNDCFSVKLNYDNYDFYRIIVNKALMFSDKLYVRGVITCILVFSPSSGFILVFPDCPKLLKT